MINVALVKLGGTKVVQKSAEVRLQSFISVALVKLGGDQSRTEVSRSQAAVIH